MFAVSKPAVSLCRGDFVSPTEGSVCFNLCSVICISFQDKEIEILFHGFKKILQYDSSENAKMQYEKLIEAWKAHE